MRIRCRCSTIVKLSLIFLSSSALMAVWKFYEPDDFSTKILDALDMDIISLQDIRKKQMKEYCARHRNNVSLDNLNLSNIMVLEKYKLLYCPISKVASTTWGTLLGKLEGVDIVAGSVHRSLKKTMKFLGQYPPKERDKMLKSFTKFMFVREPFERLLSAYRNCFWGKMKRNDPWWKKFRYGVRKFLVKIGERSINLNADNTTFEELLTYVVELWKQGGNNNIEWHFRPQFGQCHPCLIQYDVIGHYETLQDDSMFVLRKTKLLNKVSVPTWRSTNTRALMRQYYSAVTPLRFSQLKNIYKEDIEAFGYTNIPRLESLK